MALTENENGMKQREEREEEEEEEGRDPEMNDNNRNNNYNDNPVRNEEGGDDVGGMRREQLQDSSSSSTGLPGKGNMSLQYRSQHYVERPNPTEPPHVEGPIETETQQPRRCIGKMQHVWNQNRVPILAIIAIVLLGIPSALQPNDLSKGGQLTFGILLFAITFWVSEIVPIFATSVMVILLEVMLLSADGPVALAGLYDSEGFAGESGNNNSSAPGSEETQIVSDPPPPASLFFNALSSNTIILFLGGFTLSEAASKYEADHNFVRVVLTSIGTKPSKLLVGFMFVSALLSAFMSNTAATAMLVGAVKPLLKQMKPNDPMRTAIALSVPLSANVGGILTPIGSPPNAIAKSALSRAGVDISFSLWMGYMVLPVIILLVGLYLALRFFFPSETERLNFQMTGKFSTERNAVIFYIVFLVTILLWVTEAAHDISSAVVAFIPVASLTATGVLSKDDIKGLPWDVMWLIAGGISLGNAMERSGLSSWLVGTVDWDEMSIASVLALLSLLSAILATFIANTVAAAILMPIVVGLFEAGDISALREGGLVIAVSSSIAMSLPISTPPNAIVISAGLVTSKNLLIVGSLMTLLGYVTVALFSNTLWSSV